MEYGCCLNGDITELYTCFTESLIIALKLPGGFKSIGSKSSLSNLPVRLTIFFHHRDDCFMHDLITFYDSFVDDVAIFVGLLEIIVIFAGVENGKNHAYYHNNNYINVGHQQLISDDGSCRGINMTNG